MAEFSVNQIEQIARNAARNNLDRYRQAIETYVVPAYTRGATESELRAALYRASKEYHTAVNYEIYYTLPSSKASEAFLEIEKQAGRNTPNGAYFEMNVRTKMMEANQDPDPETGLWAGTVFYYVALTYLADLQLPFEQSPLANEINQQQYQLERSVFSDIESYLRQRSTGQPGTPLQNSTPVQNSNYAQPGSARQPGNYAYPGSTMQGNGTPQNGLAQSTPAYNTVATRAMNMKWYWFATNIQSILSAIAFFLFALVYLTGSIYSTNYGIPAEKFYSVYPALKVVDYCYAIALILLGTFSLVIRHGLKKRYQNAPFYYMASYAIPLIVSFLYRVETGVLFGASTFSPTFFAQIPVIGGYIVLNYVYFKKRRHLFPNTSTNYTTFIKANLIIVAIVALFGFVGAFGTF